MAHEATFVLAALMAAVTGLVLSYRLDAHAKGLAPLAEAPPSPEPQVQSQAATQESIERPARARTVASAFWGDHAVSALAPTTNALRLFVTAPGVRVENITTVDLPGPQSSRSTAAKNTRTSSDPPVSVCSERDGSATLRLPLQGEPTALPSCSADRPTSQVSAFSLSRASRPYGQSPVMCRPRCP